MPPRVLQGCWILTGHFFTPRDMFTQSKARTHLIAVVGDKLLNQ